MVVTYIFKKVYLCYIMKYGLCIGVRDGVSVIVCKFFRSHTAQLIGIQKKNCIIKSTFIFLHFAYLSYRDLEVTVDSKFID